MYRGTKDSYPCRSDLFCLLKREYQLISPEDLIALKQYLIPLEYDSSAPKKAFKRKTLTEIYPLKKGKSNGQTEHKENQENEEKENAKVQGNDGEL